MDEYYWIGGRGLKGLGGWSFLYPFSTLLYETGSGIIIVYLGVHDLAGLIFR